MASAWNFDESLELASVSIDRDGESDLQKHLFADCNVEENRSDGH